MIQALTAVQIKRNTSDLFPCTSRIRKGPGDTREDVVELFCKTRQNRGYAGKDDDGIIDEKTNGRDRRLIFDDTLLAPDTVGRIAIRSSATLAAESK